MYQVWVEPYSLMPLSRYDTNPTCQHELPPLALPSMCVCRVNQKRENHPSKFIYFGVSVTVEGTLTDSGGSFLLSFYNLVDGQPFSTYKRIRD